MIVVSIVISVVLGMFFLFLAPFLEARENRIGARIIAILFLAWWTIPYIYSFITSIF